MKAITSGEHVTQQLPSVSSDEAHKILAATNFAPWLPELSVLWEVWKTGI
jgi:hypothetical protein